MKTAAGDTEQPSKISENAEHQLITRGSPSNQNNTPKPVGNDRVTSSPHSPSIKTDAGAAEQP